MILAPADPTSLASFAFPALFRSGNLYLRTPQARIEGRVGSHVSVMGGIVAPISTEKLRSAGAASRPDRAIEPISLVVLAIPPRSDCWPVLCPALPGPALAANARRLHQLNCRIGGGTCVGAVGSAVIAPLAR
jgi:hypothetical protein